VERHLVAVAAARAQQQPQSSTSSFNGGLSLWAEVVDLTLITGVRFQDHHPAAFALIRKSCGLGDMEYVSQVERITAEKLSEGKSGAFMFFSKNGRFIIKTLEKGEADTLHGMLHRYADYLDTHKGSLLSKYLGSHTLHMYGQVFHFIVMLNVFRDAQAINAR
jgi:1-phosphatidylinositol-4-phosphate 5-kinase